MKIEVFYLEDCPNRDPALQRVREVLDETGLAAEVVQTRVSDEASARALRFSGSPTLHVNGVDVEPEARTSGCSGLACRVYRSGGHRQGVPSKQLLRDAILAASAANGSD